MPDNVSQSQHITGLDFDISKALKDLQQIEEEVQASSQRIANIDFVVGDVINNKGSFSKEMERAIILADKHKKKQEEIQAALDKNYKKNTENAKKLSDAEIAAEREKELITERVYETNERAYKLAQKGKNLSDTGYVGEQKKVKQLQEQTDELVKQLKLSGELTEEQKEQLSIIQKQLREQENVYAKTTASVEKAPTFSTIATGAKNFLRYNVANAAWQGAKSAASDVVDIETRVMEISRVMNLTTESAKDLRDNLIDYGVEYGRSFDEVSEIALKFTQAGYEANDVLSMTKAMLLGINTAELNAESGTTSLIGIMQQWGYEAEDLIDIIDKLNYTADNNAITTQDLTDALLQASSVAKIAGMSFEDTIGVLTAMKEASGRTGKEVGNAFKSIMSYIQRDSSLKIFDAAGIEVYADKATGELLPMMEILTNMANKWGSVGDEAVDALVKSADEAQLFSEDFAAVLGMEEEYNKTLREVNDKEARGITVAAAGTFRRNYFIALMEKFAKTTEISAEALNTEGYSMRENTRYMETFEAKTKQLQTSLQDLAVQAAGSGLLDLAKGAVDAAIAFVKLQNGVEGLVSPLLAIAGVLTLLKVGAIGKEISSTITVVKTAIDTIKGLETSINGVTAAEKAASLAAVGMSTALLAFAAVGAIIATVKNKLKEMEEQNKALRQTQIESYEAAMKERNELDNLKNKYDELAAVENKTKEQREELKTIGADIVKLTGDETEQLKNLTAGTKEYTDSLNEMVAAKKADMMVELAGGVAGYSGELKAAGAKFIKDGLGKKMYASEDVGNSLEKYGALQAGHMGDYARQYEAYVQAYNDLLKQTGTDAEAAKKLGEDSGFIALKQIIDEMKPSYEALMEAQKTYNQELYKSGQGSIPFAINSQDDYNRAVKEGYIVSENSAKSTDELSASLKKAGVATSEITALTEEQVKQLSAYKSEISTLNSSLSTLNDGNSLSADQIMTLIEAYPELIGEVKECGNGFTIEAELLEVRKKAYIDSALAIVATQVEITDIQKEQLLASAEYYKEEVNNIKTVADAKAEAVRLELEMQRIKLSINSRDDVEYYEQRKAEAEALIAELNAVSGQALSGIESIYDKIGASSSKANAETEKTVSILNELLADFDKFNGMGILTVSEQIEYLNYVLKDTRLTTEEVGTVQNKLFALYKQQIQEVINKEKEASEARQQAIQDTYNAKIEAAKNASNEEIESIKNAYDAEIDALKEYKSSVSEEREEEDYIEKRNKLLQERAYWEQRTGREAVEKIDDIDEQIADLDKSFVRSEEDKAIEEQVSILEKKRDNEIEYRQQLQEITIANLQAQMQMEIQAEKDKYAAFQAQFSEANINMIAAAGVYAPSLYEQFLKHFTEPMANDIISLITLFEQLFNMKASLIGGSSLNGNITVTNGGAVKASSGGYTLGDGMMMLHKNEFIVNPELTTRLDKFLEAFDNTTANYSPNAQYLKNPLTVGVPQQVSNSTNNSEKKVIIEAGAFSATYNVSDKADAKANADEFSREIMNRISKMV